MSYESPISLIYENAQRQMQIQLENGVYSAVQNVGIDVNKDELIKALQYDRQQYDKGYSDAMMNAVLVVRCEDCIYSSYSRGGIFECCKHSKVRESKFGISTMFLERHERGFYCADGERKEE